MRALPLMSVTLTSPRCRSTTRFTPSGTRTSSDASGPGAFTVRPSGATRSRLAARSGERALGQRGSGKREKISALARYRLVGIHGRLPDTHR